MDSSGADFRLDSYDIASRGRENLLVAPILTQIGSTRIMRIVFLVPFRPESAYRPGAAHDQSARLYLALFAARAFPSEVSRIFHRLK